MPRKPRKKTHGHQIEFRTPDGHRWCKTLPTKQLAEDWKRQVLVDYSKALLGQPTSATFTEVLDRFLKDKKHSFSESTQAAYENYSQRHLRDDLGARRAADITRDDLKSWMSMKRDNGLAASTVNRMLQVIRAAYNHAMEAGRVARNPAAKLKAAKGPKVREVRYLTDDEISLILAACKTARARLLVMLGLNTGMRLGEMMAMHWGWVRWDVPGKATLRIPASVEAGFVPKGKKERTLPLFPDIHHELLTYMPDKQGKARPDDPVFVGVNWRRWAAAIRKRASKLNAMRNGVDKKELEERWREFPVPFRWHLLRHTFISRLVMDGISLRIVQALAGHASIVTTEQYSHLSPDAFETVLRRFPRGIVTVR